MNDSNHPTRRPTLLVGYGRFGQEVLRRLLLSAAPRGVLAWEEPPGGARASERTLRDLALLHIPDRIALEEPEPDGTAAEAAAGGLVGDLYRQIEVLEPRSDPATDLAAAVVAQAAKLLSASARATRDDAQPLGLDVVVVVHPGEPEVLGLVDTMLVAAMDALANNANLMRAVQGAEVLNFLGILDFENYWDGSEKGRRVRRAVSSSLAQWEKRRTAGRPAFGRLYLVDGRTADGIRDARHRSDEISLFLELLLFAGQRGGELQRLWQAAGTHESPLAAFGVRLLERSAGLLSRLAAARFAVDWLDDLAGDATPGGETSRSELAERLAPYGPAELDRMLGGDELRASVPGELRTLEDELLVLPTEASDWPQQVMTRYAVTAQRITTHLAEESGQRMETVRRERLDHLAEDLRAGVEGDLHHDRHPVPIGGVIRRLEETMDELDTAASAAAATAAETASSEDPVTARRRLDDLARAWRRFRRRQVRLDGLRHQWWLVWAGALAAGLTPLAGALVNEIPPPDPSHLLLVKAYAALQWINHPIALTVALFAGFWGFGARVFHQRIAARQERAERFYRDARRGRFADRLRAELAPTGGLGGPLYRELDETLRDMALAVRSEALREIGRVLARLRERRREMLWLRDELADFLKLHGLTLTGGWHELDRRQRDGTGIRQAVERGEDLERMLGRNPPSPERFRSTQADQRPFAQWDEPYGDAFLHPLPFVDRLSRLYDQEDGDLADPGQDFLAFLDRHGAFDLAFAWKAQEGVPAARRYCLLPASWRRRPDVLGRLADLRTPEENVLAGGDEARAYLLRLQTGIAGDCLLEAGS